MPLQIVLASILVLLHFSAAAHDESSYGTGISLSSDYGIASVYFGNGTYIDIAKIEGGEEYKASMLRLRQTITSTSITVPRYCPYSQQLCKYWHFQSVSVATQSPLAPMLMTLLSATAATLETEVSSMMVAMHVANNVNGSESASVYIRSAFDGMDATCYGRHFRVINSLVDALQLEGECNDPYEMMYPRNPERHVVDQLFLGIEYTSSSLDAAMFDQPCGLYEMLSRVSSSKVGYDAISACRNTADNTTACNDALETSLRRVIRDAGSYNTRKKL